MQSARQMYTGPMRFAHRGVVQVAPENTLPAFMAAVEAGAEGIEIDIRMSRDGEIIVVHDENLTRLTLGHPQKSTNARIVELDWEALSTIELPYANHLLDDAPPPDETNELLATRPMRVAGQEHGRDYISEFARDARMGRLMRLTDLLQWLAGQPGDTVLEIECKAPGMIKRLLPILDASPLCARCILFSGQPDIIEEIQSACAREGKPEGLKLGANIRQLTQQTKDIMQGMDLYEVGLNDGWVNEQDMAWLTDRGIKAFSNLGDYPAWWERICELPMHGFKTNYIHAYTDWWMNRT